MTKDEMQQLTVAGLREGMEIMREALRALYDEQNDAPLEKRRPQWEAAMKLAREALALESQAEPRAPQTACDEETCPKCGGWNVSPFICKEHGDVRKLSSAFDPKSRPLPHPDWRSGSVKDEPVKSKARRCECNMEDCIACFPPRTE